MKNLKKTISMILAAVLVLVSLTACSGGKKESLTIGVPNDTTNEARALLLLQELLLLAEGLLGKPLHHPYRHR